MKLNEFYNPHINYLTQNAELKIYDSIKIEDFIDSIILSNIELANKYQCKVNITIASNFPQYFESSAIIFKQMIN